MSKYRSSLALENDGLYLPLQRKKLSRERDQYNTMLISTHLWSRNLQFTFLCMIPGKIRCRRLFVSLSINVYFDWRSHCKSQSMIMLRMMTQIEHLLASVNKRARVGCLFRPFTSLVYLAHCAFCFRWNMQNARLSCENWFDFLFRNCACPFHACQRVSGKKPFPHHVVYDNYVAIEIIIFLTQSWHTSHVCILYSCVITVQQIGGKQKGNRSFGNP